MKEYFIIKILNKKQYILNISEKGDDITCTYTSVIGSAKKWKDEDLVKSVIFKLSFVLDSELEYIKKKKKTEKIVQEVSKEIVPEKKVVKKKIIKKEIIIPVVVEKEIEKETFISNIGKIINKKIKKLKEDIKYYC